MLRSRTRASQAASHQPPTRGSSDKATDGAPIASADSLLLGIDYGTAALKIAYCFVTNGQKAKVNVVRLLDKKADIPSHVAFQDGTFVWGHDLSGRLNGKQPRVDPHNVVRHPKLMLYDDTSDATANQEKAQSEAILKNILADPKDVFAYHLKAIITCVQQHISINARCHYTADEVMRMSVHATISIPQMWGPGARKIMTRAAQLAGLASSKLVSEPQCILAAYLDELTAGVKLGLPTQVGKDDHIEVWDFGGGTGDLVDYCLEDDLTSQSRFKAVGESRGALCGSYKVNQVLLESIVEQHDTEADRIAIDLLGASGLRAFEWSLLKTIEDVKTKRPMEMFNSVVARNLGTGASKQYDISSQQIESAHADSLDAILSKARDLVKQFKPKLVVLAGGFAQSEVLRTGLSEEFEGDGICLVDCMALEDAGTTAVARGSLSARYDDISQDELPPRYDFAFLQDMHADPEIHPDCYKDDGEEDMARLGHSLLDGGEGDGSLIAIDRLRIVMQGGKPTTEARNGEVVQEYYPFEDKPELYAKFVYLDQDFVSGESALADGYDPAAHNNRLRPGVHHWDTVSVALDPAQLWEHGIGKFSDDENVVRWDITAKLSITYETERKITVKWTVLDTDGAEAFEVESQELWNADFQEFTIEHDGDAMDTPEG